ncbi:MAG: hypothetical protein KatS3mg003_2112 [Candidatus Nitrosocaldaceae archaeon]|nr:MAG: hypothetical protein KatS3mg003_2047 [Candidatus Nitrosocaldaceae archaeon]GIU72633.1 MAG: hypothetical protein KatS3mg003_2112 [Candidatus Nitrosocaldaceae archaeon]
MSGDVEDKDKFDEYLTESDYVLLYRELESRLESLEEIVARLSKEVAIIKKAVRNDIARYEINRIKQGYDINSILDD